MKILIVGDIVGSPGRTIFARLVTLMKQAQGVDFVSVNGENAAAGRGINPRLVQELLDGGADVITLGDHTWDQKELQNFIDGEPRLVRPANFAPVCPGRGLTTIDTPKGPVTVINLIGRVFMQPHDCPYRKADELLKEKKGLGRVILVDFHAEVTSEKIAMGRYLDGRVSAVVGTHTHVQTADEAILPRGTAYITDLGMTGPKDSILGRDVDSILRRMTTGMPTKFSIATDDVRMEGVLLDVDEQTGKTRNITRIRKG